MDDNEVDRPRSSKAKTGFQAMGLSFNMLKGITKRGYKIPTPVQRKTIPLILEGRDVVAMAKTGTSIHQFDHQFTVSTVNTPNWRWFHSTPIKGSGKTACFLIPMFEKLQTRSPNSNARALILSPTRELAVQTFKFIKEIGKYMDLKTILVLGGDPMSAQFQAIHSCPDIIVATPGRFLHLCVEMELKLSAIRKYTGAWLFASRKFHFHYNKWHFSIPHPPEYVVFDEADRLFEMGFGEQLNETLARLPDSRQMVMFSATLPKMLVDFAKAGLSDPVLIRLGTFSSCNL